jgi:hypothetical protein
MKYIYTQYIYTNVTKRNTIINKVIRGYSELCEAVPVPRKLNIFCLCQGVFGLHT